MDHDFVTLNYRIPGNDDGGRIFIYGQPEDHGITQPPLVESDNDHSNNTIHILFFCGGFPDTCSTFQPLAQRLVCSKKNLICGVTCLPGYDIHHNNFQKGYTFDEMVVALREACNMLVSHVTEAKAKMTLPADITLTGIFHDWGCYIGAMLVNRMNMEAPRYFGNVVYLDILPPLHPNLGIPRASMSISRALIITLYTSLFATCHVIQRYLSHWIAAPLGLIGYSLITLFGLAPIRSIDHKTFLMNGPKDYSLRKIISMQYPYYNLWRGFLFQGPKTFLTKTVGDATRRYFV
jgi:hypothetical protein